MRQFNGEQKAFLYLLWCALHGQKPENAFSEVDYRRLYEMAQYQSLTALIYYPLSKVDSWQRRDPELAARWKEKKEKAIAKECMVLVESEAICKMLEENAIWHLPLKGYVLRNFYPEIGMREMADQDILFDPQMREKVKSLMSSRGYEAIYYHVSNHDVYRRAPVFEYEMHTSLFAPIYDKRWIEYYSNIYDRLLREEDRPYHLQFTDEDFYVYMILHGYKHYSYSGHGLRSLTDVWVYRNSHPQMDREYIVGELSMLGEDVQEYESTIISLAETLFDQESYEEESVEDRLASRETEMLKWLFSSGTYGTFSQEIEMRIRSVQKEKGVSASKAKRVYIWRRFFPDMDWINTNAPFVYEHKILLPGYYVYRILTKGIQNRKKLWREWQTLKK